MFSIALLLLLTAAVHSLPHKRVLPAPKNTTAAAQALCDFSKSPHQITSQCPLVLSGLHLLCGTASWTSSVAECARFGLVPAAINAGNYGDAVTLITACTSGEQVTYIGSFNGYAEPCIYLDPVDGLVTLADPECNIGYLEYIMCEEIVLTNRTVTVVETTSVSYGTSTVILPTYDPAHCRSPWLDDISNSSSSDTDSSSSSSGPSYPKAIPVVKTPNQLPLCPANVCPVEIASFRVIDGPSCTAFGWIPADITTGQLTLIKSLFSSCVSFPLDRLYVRSFDGISAECVAVIGKYGEVYVGMGLTPLTCGAPGLQLCEVSGPPAVTGTGLAGQSTSTTTTWTTTSTTTSTVPTVTSTLTSYAVSSF